MKQLSLSLSLWLLAMGTLSGCSGESTRPTLDYAPENVQRLREVQGLEKPATEDDTADADSGSEEADEE